MNQINPYGAYARTDIYGRPLPPQMPAYMQYQMQPYASMQQEPVQQSAPQPQIGCEIVGDYETVKAAQISLDGQPKYYPLSDGSAVYRKQLMADGTSKIFKYALVTDDAAKQAVSTDTALADAIKSVDTKIDTLSKRVDEIMSMWGGNDGS
nr:MAG TPA: hypothetical protein [Caudoviricetes sp.]DAV24611.1 MAG TPA: hypothetical protein [Caudoviricetes sp.]